jgi:DNA-binding MarR family transcriptional regulator
LRLGKLSPPFDHNGCPKALALPIIDYRRRRRSSFDCFLTIDPWRICLPALNKDDIRNESLPFMVLIDAANVAQRSLEKRLVDLKLSVAQQRILALVYVAKEPLTPSMLAALLLQETHSVSGLLNRLEDRDLITRTRDKQDRRVVWVGLTSEGKQVAEEAIDVALKISKEYDSILRGPTGTEVTEVMRKVRDLGFRIAGVKEEIRREALKRVWG